MFCEVVIDLINNQVNKTYDYLIPDNLIDVIEVGHRVYVPFGRQKRLGIVMKIKDESSFEISKIKSIIDVLDIKPILNQEFIDLSYYMVKHYFTFFISALLAMIPSALKVNYVKKFRLLTDDVNENFKLLFNKKKELNYNESYQSFLPYIKKLLILNKLEMIDSIKDKASVNKEKMVSLINPNIKTSSKKALELLAYLDEINDDIPLNTIYLSGYTKSTIDTLLKYEAIKIYEEEIFKDDTNYEQFIDKDIILNSIQDNAYQEIKNNINTDKTYLLHGVTGSGKTEIYLNIINDVINQGKEAIMLVPEISLTPQMTYRFKSRFKDNVAVLHSRLSVREKYDEWRKIANNKVKIVVGARSAIFAPFKNLGAIIIDEEHDKSYYQESNPKYNALDIARFRSKYHKAVLVLGSATPKIGDYYKSLNHEYQLLELKERANNSKMPNSEIIDMREELKTGNKSIFSRKLSKLIVDRFNKGEQTILFLNKRGFSTFVMCRECGEVIKCPHCDVSLTYHKTTNSLKCHYCGYQIPNVTTCPKCQSQYIRFVGGGTEKVYDELIKLIPEIKAIRVDSDTTKDKDAYNRIFNEFKNHMADVMIGTQMITKGLDFPLCTLVGVLNADISLKFPDYDCFETTYDLLEQVSGRAGRADILGDVIIQSYDPTHYSLVCAKNHDYLGFYKKEIKSREMLNNPPFKERVEIMISSRDLLLAKKTSFAIIDKLKLETKSIIYGPAEALIFKVNDCYRFTINIKFDSEESVLELNKINEEYQNKKDILISITRM